MKLKNYNILIFFQNIIHPDQSNSNNQKYQQQTREMINCNDITTMATQKEEIMKITM